MLNWSKPVMVPLALLAFAGAVSSQQQLIAFHGSAPDSCALGGIHVSGYQSGDTTWILEGPQINYQGVPGGLGYEAYSWTLSDADGTIATGSYDSRTGDYTNGMSASGGTATATRAPVGGLDSMSFTGYIQLYAEGEYGACQENTEYGNYGTPSFYYQ